MTGATIADLYKQSWAPADLGLPPSCSVGIVMPTFHDLTRIVCFGCHDELGAISGLEFLANSKDAILHKIDELISTHREKFNPTLADLIDWGWFDAEASA